MLRFQNKVPAAISIGGKIVERIKMNDEVVWGRVQTPLYIQNTYNGTNTISVKQTLTGSPDSGAYAKHLQYSKDGLNWTTITLSSTAYTISLAKNERVYFRGNERVFNYWTSGGTNKAITTISGTQNHTVGGNINTLLDYTDPYGLILPQGAFNSMFENDTKLTSASDITLPPSADGTVSTYCYLYMFKGCSALTSVPQSLPVAIMTNSTDAYDGMFANTAITTAPALPSTQLGNNCYWSMFEGCTALVNAPALPAMTLTTSCYNRMFYGCSSLVNAPALPATTLANQCYQQMFRYCTSLTTAPSVIPATTSPYMCCQRMFSDCTALTSVPTLPATIVESGCYQYMFFGCTSLTTAQSELPAQTLTLNCYYSMFEGCNKLTTAPEIKAKTFAKQSCTVMFRNCTSLNNVTVYADDNSAEKCTDRWLYNVAASGTFNNYGSATYTANNASGIPTGWNLVNGTNYFYIENKNYSGNGSNTLEINTNTSSPTSDNYATTLQYSKDKTNWTTISLDGTEHSISLAKNEKVYFRNNSGYFNWCDSMMLRYVHTHFNCLSLFAVGGNVMSLIDYNNMNSVQVSDGCFNNLFKYSSTLTDASNLIMPNRTAPNCFREMFTNCSALTNSPALPAMSLSTDCYNSMFNWCSKLTVAPTLPATTLATSCYYGLFSNCSSLKNAPALPATTLAESCYKMMYYKCTSLEVAPALPATTLVNECYAHMFNNCTKLNTMTVSANDISASNCIYRWLYDSGTGTFHNLGTATYTRNKETGIPSGWTIVNT